MYINHASFSLYYLAIITLYDLLFVYKKSPILSHLLSNSAKVAVITARYDAVFNFQWLSYLVEIHNLINRIDSGSHPVDLSVVDIKSSHDQD